MALPRLPMDVLSQIGLDELEQSKDRRRLLRLTEKQTAQEYALQEDSLLRTRLRAFFGKENFDRIEASVTKMRTQYNYDEAVPTGFWDSLWESIKTQRFLEVGAVNATNGKMVLYIVGSKLDKTVIISVKFADAMTALVLWHTSKTLFTDRLRFPPNQHLRTIRWSHELFTPFLTIGWDLGPSIAVHQTVSNCFLHALVAENFAKTGPGTLLLGFKRILDEQFAVPWQLAEGVVMQVHDLIKARFVAAMRTACAAYLLDPSLVVDEGLPYIISLPWLPSEHFNSVNNLKLWYLCQGWYKFVWGAFQKCSLRIFDDGHLIVFPTDETSTTFETRFVDPDAVETMIQTIVTKKAHKVRQFADTAQAPEFYRGTLLPDNDKIVLYKL